MSKKSPDQFLKEIENANKGRLKLYIGAAPGVGKTCEMLRDAHEMRETNIDVVVGLVETYGRKGTAEQIKDLELIPLKEIHYKGVVLKELDLDGITKRKPQVVIVDELAHTNVPTSKNKKRYQDVLELINSGISVMTAVNIQHLESLNDYVNRMTGVKVRETIPDSMLEIADEVEVIDISIDALRDRLKSGKIYSKDKIETALNNFFRVGNLTALRELTLREVANEVDEHLMEYKKEKHVEGLVGAQEKILVCVNVNFNAEYLIRRGYRISKMLKAPLYVLHVRRENISEDKSKLRKLDDLTQLCSKLDAKFQVATSKDAAVPIIKFAKENGITQVIIGQSARTRWHEILRGSIVRKIMRGTKYVDVLVVADPRE
ncbi:KdpD-like non-kinase potassium sensor [Clostridium sp. CX1]|uniref:KdpD-like non-kinase potassium sensor n=1 Tax=Clostridium tanneri TaxID=3037988 RepID=A0ABU4JW29_9CLOT|nr:MULTISPECIES: KdpD-like non-kinase potassium sensor [unclassified Clostridium]MCT8975238.1 KdpD-like non-kinase potassium sensor [Clostridium sp. CX1]MDW8802124.1 KdpD-like non-kinase potassium sensor [Clostridium sp. A1-XYC3]